jgi:outer membrane lipoprotein-sorting protein
MLRRAVLPAILLSLAVSPVIGANAPSALAELTAAQIVDKNVEARGGLKAWRAVQSLSFLGKMDAGGKQHTQLPFVLEMKRPRKTRVEIEFENERSIQVYDGAKGWKLRPYLGRKDVEPFTPDELKAASLQSDLDGPLIDYAAKGTKVELEGVERTEEGRDAYNLKLTMKDGRVQHIWIDKETFLEIKSDGAPRRMDGRMHPVQIHYSEYTSVSGLMLPHVLETTVVGVNHSSHKMTIETVQVNPKLDDSLFKAPESGLPSKTKASESLSRAPKSR